MLSATDAQIGAALDELDAALAAQEVVLKEALAAADAAAVAQRQAEADLRAAERDVVILEQAIVEMAVASYVRRPRPPTWSRACRPGRCPTPSSSRSTSTPGHSGT